jgi:hypothetical protein
MHETEIFQLLVENTEERIEMFKECISRYIEKEYEGCKVIWK